MEVSPSDQFAEIQTQANQFGFTTADPLYTISNALRIKAAAPAQQGIITTAAQSFGGEKSIPVPDIPADVHLAVNSVYLNSAINAGVTWLKPAINFANISGIAGQSDGDRYIATVSGGGITAEYIYQWDADASGWVEHIPVETNAIYVSDARQSYQFISNSWAPFYVSIGGDITAESITLNDPVTPQIQFTRGTSTITGSLAMSAGGVMELAGAPVSITNTSPATSTNSGALQIAGGLAIAGATRSNSTIRANGAISGSDFRLVDALDNVSGIIQGAAGIMELVPQTGYLNLRGDYVNIASTQAAASTTTGALRVAGGGAIAGDLHVGGAIVGGSISAPDLPSTFKTLTVTGGDDSISTSTGAVVVTGGMGVSEEVHAAAFVSNGLVSGDSLEMTRAPNSIYSKNGIIIVGEPNLSGCVGLEITNQDTDDAIQKFNVLARNKKLVIRNETTAQDIATFEGNTLRIEPTGANALICSGELSAATAIISDTLPAISTNTGALQIRGGLTTSNASYLAGDVKISATTACNSTATGALQILGGLGLAKALYAGSHLWTAGNLYSQSGTVFTGGLSASGFSTLENIVSITKSDASTSTTTGGLQVTGGIGVGGASYFGNSISANTATIRATTASTSTITGALQVVGGIAAGAASYFGDGVSASTAEIRATTASTSTNTGALICAGGGGFGGNIYHLPVYEDFPIIAFTRGGSATWGATTLSGIYAYKFSATTSQDIQANIQMPHAWQEGSSVISHIHVGFNGAPTPGQAVRIRTVFSKSNSGWNTPTDISTSTENNATIETGGVGDGQIYVLQGPTISMTGLTKSAHLFMQLIRIGNDAADTETREMYVYSWDLHYKRNRMGAD